MTFSNMSYNGQNSVVWVVKIKKHIVRLTTRNAILFDRFVRITILKTLVKEFEYKNRVNIIRHITFNIVLEDL